MRDIKRPFKGIINNSCRNLLDLGEREEQEQKKTIIQTLKHAWTMRNKTMEVRYNVATDSYQTTIH